MRPVNALRAQCLSERDQGGINMHAFKDDTGDDSSEELFELLPSQVQQLLKKQLQQEGDTSEHSVLDKKSESEFWVCRDGEQYDDSAPGVAALGYLGGEEALVGGYAEFAAGVTDHSESLYSGGMNAGLEDVAAAREQALSNLDYSMEKILRDLENPSDCSQQGSGDSPLANNSSVKGFGGGPPTSVADEEVAVDQSSSNVGDGVALPPPAVEQDSPENLQLVQKLLDLFQDYYDHLINNRKYVADERDTQGRLTHGAHKIACTDYILKQLTDRQSSAKVKINTVQTYLNKGVVQRRLIRNCDEGLLLLKALSCLLVLPSLILAVYSRVKDGTCNFFESRGRQTLEKAEEVLLPRALN